MNPPLRPKSRRSIPLRALAIAVSVLALAALVRQHWPTVPSLTAIAESAAIMGIVFMCVACLLLVERQAHAVELSDVGVSGLKWGVQSAWPYIGLFPLSIPWQEVQRVGVSGLAVVIQGSSGKLNVNTLLFADPPAVLRYINARHAEVRRSVASEHSA
jgi:hypothetical protein